MTGEEPAGGTVTIGPGVGDAEAAASRICRLPARLGHSAHVGWFGGDTPAAITVDDGDVVETATLGLWAGAVGPDADYADVLRVRAENAGHGPHTLTGPIAVRGTLPGDAVGVELLDLEPEGHGINLATPHGVSRGVLSDRFPDGYLRHFRIDAAAGIAQAGVVRVPVHPFLGFVGVAPTDGAVHGSVVPGVFGGNLDVPAATVGSTIWLPVQRRGALVYLGDGHAAQGQGELNGTAIECGMTRVVVRIRVLRGVRLTFPRVTDAHRVISCGLGASLDEAVRTATQDLLAWLTDLGMGAEDAYTLCSVAATLSVSQVVNRTVGVYAAMARDLIRPVQGRSERSVWEPHGP